MTEKTKKILSYIACALGGMALGIALLGGLAMCASPANKQKAESVNTILTPRRTDMGAYEVTLIEGYETLNGYKESVTYTRNQTEDLVLFGGTTSESIQPTLILPAEVKINYAPTFENSTIQSVTFAIYKSTSGFPTSWDTWIQNSPLGGIGFYRPVSQVTYWYSWGFAWSATSEIYGESTGYTIQPSTQWSTSILAYQRLSQVITWNNEDDQAYARYGIAGGIDLTPAYGGAINIYRSMLNTGNDQYEDGYDAGYSRGREDGLNLGMQLGTEGGNMTNIFALFTSAFTAVGGFFNLKIFGFLPLYWVFLAPLFIALITLLLRMVKH